MKIKIISSVSILVALLTFFFFWYFVPDNKVVSFRTIEVYEENIYMEAGTFYRGIFESMFHVKYKGYSTRYQDSTLYIKIKYGRLFGTPMRHDTYRRGEITSQNILREKRPIEAKTAPNPEAGSLMINYVKIEMENKYKGLNRICLDDGQDKRIIWEKDN